MSDLEKLKTEIALLKKDAKTGELIHQRLEVAVDKLTEITISLKGMIAQQQTKLEPEEKSGIPISKNYILGLALKQEI